jgi:hypothetical protein
MIANADVNKSTWKPIAQKQAILQVKSKEMDGSELQAQSCCRLFDAKDGEQARTSAASAQPKSADL